MKLPFSSHPIFKKTILIAVLLSFLLPIFSIRIHAEEVDGSTVSSSHTLSESEDAGNAYLDQLIFFGESTTAHLSRHGGIMDTDTNRRQVWRDQSGTRILNRRILTSPIDYILPDGSVSTMTFREALLLEHPNYLVLSFGLNGIVDFANNPNRFLDTYSSLIEQIRSLSPHTNIILQSVYPVCNADAFSVDLSTLNADICFLNQQIRWLADQTDGVRFVDTASVLCGKDGSLLPQYDIGDGIHLTNDAYRMILLYLRTHAWV